MVQKTDFIPKSSTRIIPDTIFKNKNINVLLNKILLRSPKDPTNLASDSLSWNFKEGDLINNDCIQSPYNFITCKKIKELANNKKPEVQFNYYYKLLNITIFEWTFNLKKISYDSNNITYKKYTVFKYNFKNIFQYFGLETSLLSYNYFFKDNDNTTNYLSWLETNIGINIPIICSVNDMNYKLHKYNNYQEIDINGRSNTILDLHIFFGSADISNYKSNEYKLNFSTQLGVEFLFNINMLTISLGSLYQENIILPFIKLSIAGESGNKFNSKLIFNN